MLEKPESTGGVGGGGGARDTPDHAIRPTLLPNMDWCGIAVRPGIGPPSTFKDTQTSVPAFMPSATPIEALPVKKVGLTGPKGVAERGQTERISAAG